MARTYLNINTVNHSHQNNSYENIQQELDKKEQDIQNNLTRIREQMLNSGEGDDSALKAEAEAYRARLSQTLEDKEFLEKYPDTFPYLYSFREHGEIDDISGKLTEVLDDEQEIITEAQDVNPKEERLELSYELDGVPFSVSVDPYDKPGEDDRQLRGRISFTDKSIEELNESRLKAILDFCEKHGFSSYDIDIPMKDGVVDLDEKLAELTKKVLEEKKQQDVENPGAGPEDVLPEHFNVLETQIDDLSLGADGKAPINKAKKPQTYEDIRAAMIEMFEQDMKKTRGLSYFENRKGLDGLKTAVFSIYDKPDPDNMKKDGIKDKNGIYVPTYAFRFYLAQDPKDGHYVFGYSTPGGKKMDDTMAGDFLGIVKKTGATHVKFSSLSSVDKGVWMMACAEKGLVPIGISLNMAKAKKMVDAAKNKLSSEEFNLFKKRLGAQMLENAQKKNADDKYFGLPKSEYDFIQNLKTGYEFSNFKFAFEDEGGLYTTTMQKINEGASDSKEGAATTFGAMSALRDVFDIYMKYQHEPFGKFLQEGTSGRRELTKEELDTLKMIPADRSFMDLTKEDFMAIYNTLLPRRIEDAKQDIYKAYRRELKRKPQRADGVVLGSDLFPKVKAEVNGINIALTRNGIDTLTLPNEHSGLEFARPDWLQPGAQNTQTTQQSNTNQSTAGNAAVNAQAQNAGNSR